MVSKNNVQVKDRYATKQVPHYGIRKLSVGVASVLLGTTFYMGMNGNVVHADTVNGQGSETPDSQVANSNTNSESKSGTGANAALGDSQAVVSAAEDAVKSEINAKPQVTEITNGSHVQSDVNAVKSDVDVQSQNNQNGANTTQTTQTQTMRVNNFASQAGNISPNAVSANLIESTDDTVMQQAIQQTSTLRDDRSTDYPGYIKGQAQSVTLKDGSSLSVNSDVINSYTDKSAILTFKSASFKPGDTYTILIPRIMMNKDSDVAHLQPSFGTTSVDEIEFNDGYTRQNRKKSSQEVNLRDTDHAKDRYAEVLARVLGKKAKTDYYTEANGTYMEDSISLDGNDWTWGQHRTVSLRAGMDDFEKVVSDYLSFRVDQVLKGRKLHGAI